MISISYMFLNEFVSPEQIRQGMETTKRTTYDIKQEMRKEREQNMKRPIGSSRPIMGAL